MNEYRLLILSLALWLGAAITGLGSHWNVVVLILIALALLINYRGAALILIAALLVGSLGLVIREVTLRNNLISLASLSKTQIQLLATVQSDPILGSGKVVGSHLMRGSYSFKVRSEVVTIGKAVTHIRLPVRVSSRIKIAVIPGDRIDCEGRVLATRERKVAALFVANQACTIIHSASRLEVLTSIIRRTFRTDCLAIAGDVGALIPGMVLGDTSLQTSKFSSQMRRTGLTHLTAVSGENFAIIAAFLLWISQWFFRNIKVRIIVTGIFLIGFIFLVRPSPSVLRACVMTATLLIARLKGERSAALPALGLAISVLILLDPFQATDPGFALSVAATAGILLLSPAINQKLEPYLGKFSDAIAIPLSATLLCTPIIVAISGQFSLITLPANIAVAAVVAPITILGLIAALIAPLAGWIAHALLIMVAPFSNWIVFIAHEFSKLPVLLLPKNWFGILLVMAIFGFLIKGKLKFLAAGMAICVVLLFFPFGSWPGPDWVFASCDIGQGDGSVINLGRQAAIVIDVGPDPVLMDKCLARLKIKRIALLVLTHFHADHVLGLLGAVRNRKIDQVWLTNLDQPAAIYELTMKSLLGISSTVVHRGESLDIASLGSDLAHGKIMVLWPLVEPQKLAVMPGDGSGINNSSITLLISINGFRIFDGGDIEPPVQEIISRLPGLGEVDLLKVSHHGSAYQYWPLLDKLHPKIAVISVGSGNTYGHPAPITLTELSKRGIKVFRTDLAGSIAIAPSFKIRTIKNDWWRISWG